MGSAPCRLECCSSRARGYRCEHLNPAQGPASYTRRGWEERALSYLVGPERVGTTLSLPFHISSPHLADLVVLQKRFRSLERTPEITAGRRLGCQGQSWLGGEDSQFQLSCLRPLGLPRSLGVGPNQWASHFLRELLACQAVRVPERDPLVVAEATAAWSPEYGTLG